MKQNEVDVCCIGGGIASLYTAYRILQIAPQTRILILERNDRLGGRAHMVSFHGVNIMEGAGVGRFRKDRLLRALMTELGMDVRKFYSKHSFQPHFEPVDIRATVAKLKTATSKYDRNRVTFSQFAKRELGLPMYKRFVASCGYSDFEQADIVDTLYHYGFEDTMDGNLFYVPWNDLVEALATRVGSDRILLGTAATAVESVADGRISVSHSHGSVVTKKLVFGTTISTVRALMSKERIYRHIHAQPFLRIYAKIRPNPSFETMVGSYLVVANSPLQKIIRMGAPSEGVYMIAYADNKHAEKLAPNAYNKNHLQKVVYDALRVPVEIEDVYVKYWNEGTHYYPPLPKSFASRKEFVFKAQHPSDHVFVVGEAVALRYQGWTQGALESVHEVLDNILQFSR